MRQRLVTRGFGASQGVSGSVTRGLGGDREAAAEATVKPAVRLPRRVTWRGSSGSGAAAHTVSVSVAMVTPRLAEAPSRPVRGTTYHEVAAKGQVSVRARLVSVDAGSAAVRVTAERLMR